MSLLVGSRTLIYFEPVGEPAANKRWIDLKAESVNLTMSKNIQNESVISKHDYPNTELNDMGVNNRIWDITGRIDVTDLKPYDSNPTIYPLSIELAGSLIKDTGSKFFIDEVMAISGIATPHWVKVSRFTFRRSNEFGKSPESTGHIVSYTAQLIETGDLTD